MKRGYLIALMLFLFIGFASAATKECTINVSMINQDPYPAMPGETVKVIFQINGVSNPDCGTVKFEVKENFPFTIDPSSQNPITINSGIYAKNYSSFYIAPYKIRINTDALKGDTPIEVGYTSSSLIGERFKDFTIYVENTKADFEIYVKDYSSATSILTLEILNIEDVDVQALTIEIPKQENVEIKGANKVVVGDLDSNEYTTADFEALLKDGDISLKIVYTDSTNTRREITKTVEFDSSYFNGRKGTSQPVWLYILIPLLIAAFIAWRIYRKKKKKKLLHH